jgi:hypothetical protein
MEVDMAGVTPETPAATPETPAATPERSPAEPETPVFTPPAVRQIALPPAARALSTLSRIDYEDAFLVAGVPDRDPTSEEWSRMVLEQTPAIVRFKLLCGWSALGLKLGSPRSRQRVLGWEVRRRTPDMLLLGADSRIGLPGELLFLREPNGMLFATFTQQTNAVARAAWAAIIPTHQRVVRSVLGHAAGRLLAQPV